MKKTETTRSKSNPALYSYSQLFPSHRKIYLSFTGFHSDKKLQQQPLPLTWNHHSALKLPVKESPIRATTKVAPHSLIFHSQSSGNCGADESLQRQPTQRCVAEIPLSGLSSEMHVGVISSG